jgi:hypothetical protein
MTEPIVTHRCTAEIDGAEYGHKKVMCAGVRTSDGKFHNTCHEPCRWIMGKTGEGSPPWPEPKPFDPTEPDNLLPAKAKALVDMLDDAERNHGGLYAGKTMTAANELRLELAKWGTK